MLGATFVLSPPTKGFSMTIRLLFITSALLCASSALFSSVVSRYIPSFSTALSQSSQLSGSRPTVSLASIFVQASKSSPLVDDQYEMYKFDGLLEMNGWYDLHEIVAATKEAQPGYVSPFVRETGANTLATRQLLFGAQSSVTGYAVECAAQAALGQYVRVGVSLPLWHVEARQRYAFPVVAADQLLSEPQREQAQRLRQMAHQDLGLVQKDWSATNVGDVSGWAEVARTWRSWWLLRTMEWAARLTITAPTGLTEEAAYPSSFALGNGGSWGLGFSVQPRIEVKECVWFQMPVSLVVQTTNTRLRRLPVYAEPMPFGVLRATVQTRPGLTLHLEPTLTFQHFIDNLHLLFGLSWTKHYADTLTDCSAPSATASYLTRTRLPATSFGATLSALDQRNRLASERSNKRQHSAWRRTYFLFGAQYELADIFPAMKYPPLFNFGVNYCIGQHHAAKMHQLTAGFSWRF